jgi:diguanylate cyclase (GGDEF)-like protein
MVKNLISYWVNLRTIRRIFHQQPVILWVISCASVFVVAVADYFTGSLVTLSAFYLGPLILVAWKRSRTQAQMMILLIVISWATANYYSAPEYYSLGVVVWNAFVRWLHLTLTADLLILFSKSQDELKLLANIDTLTGIANRRSFNTELVNILNDVKVNDMYLTMAIIDVDFFKQINDEYGHPHGDFKLKQVASVLVITCSERDLCGRLGGDEFGVVFVSSNPNSFQVRLEMLSKRLNTEATACSIGAFVIDGVSATPELLYEQADRALYKTKFNGRGFVTITSNSPNSSDILK